MTEFTPTPESSTNRRIAGIFRYAGGQLLEELLSDLRANTNPRSIEVRDTAAEYERNRPKLWIVRANELRLTRGRNNEQEVLERAARTEPRIAEPIPSLRFVSDTFKNSKGERFGMLYPPAPGRFLVERSAIWSELNPHMRPMRIEPDVTIYYVTKVASDRDVAVAGRIVAGHIQRGMTVDLTQVTAPELPE